MVMNKLQAQHWAGLDWGDKEHVVCIVDATGQRRCRVRVTHNAEGLDELIALLRATPDLLGLAVETSRHLAVDVLARAGFTLYPVNPKMAHAWRECYSVTGVKNDALDAWVLAEGLRIHHGTLRPLAAERPLTRELRLLAEQEQGLIQQRTALVCELKSVLKMYFPAALDWFNDWTTRTSWDFVLTFGTPQSLAQASTQKLCAFFKTHRIGLRPQLIERIKDRAQALAMTGDAPTTAACSLRAQGLARQLRVVQETATEHRRRIQQLYPQHELAPIISSLPPAGPKLAPRLLCLFGDNPERYESAHSVCELAGTVPVTAQSGRTRIVKFRRACQRKYRNTMHQFAFVSITRCAWARAFYDTCRQRGQSQAEALRNLATKWIKIIFRLWRERTAYDEQRYLDALRRSQSPLSALVHACNDQVNKSRASA
jgi:transposase